MTFDEFGRRADELFHSIPEEYRNGVDGIEVLRKTVPHPTIPDVYTLGECLSEFYPSDFGGAGEVQSRVVLYYGSFLELSRTDDEWDWEDELWETISHEVRHHLEHLAAEDALEELDYAADQNFARRDGQPFDPFFYRSGEELERGAYKVDDDVFVELLVDEREMPAGGTVVAELGEERLEFIRPDSLGDVHFAQVVGDEEGRGEVVVVLVRRRRAGEWLKALVTRPVLDVRQSEISLLRAEE